MDRRVPHGGHAEFTGRDADVGLCPNLVPALRRPGGRADLPWALRRRPVLLRRRASGYSHHSPRARGAPERVRPAGTERAPSLRAGDDAAGSSPPALRGDATRQPRGRGARAGTDTPRPPSPGGLTPGVRPPSTVHAVEAASRTIRSTAASVVALAWVARHGAQDASRDQPGGLSAHSGNAAETDVVPQSRGVRYGMRRKRRPASAVIEPARRERAPCLLLGSRRRDRFAGGRE